MDAGQYEICQSFGKIRFFPGSFDKKFALNMFHSNSSKELTDSQNEWIYRILYKYRAQIPNVYNKYKKNQLCSKK